MKVICFGDSNTYGYDPRSYLGDRYPSQSRWVDLLQAKTGWKIQNQGLNGRTIPDRSVEIPEDTDLLLVMLGTNDILEGFTPEQTGKKMKRFLESLTLERKNILLLVPPSLTSGEWVDSPERVKASERLGQEYGQVAHQLGIAILDTVSWKIPLAYDGVHFTQMGHQRFAEKLYKELMNRKYM